MAGGARRIPASRYTSTRWQDLEAQRLWTRVWQIACTLDCVSEPGDYWVYEIGSQSIIILRGQDGEIRAFQNACRHRGNLLLKGSGRGLDEVSGCGLRAFGGVGGSKRRPADS